jgi:hypothetical protein
MARNPGTPQPPSGPSQPGASGPPDGPAQPEERYGILRITRQLKDDGRSLLLYRREESDPE